MPRVIEVGDQEPCTPDEAFAALCDAGLDARDPHSVAQGAHWLARLHANRDFLGDRLIDMLGHKRAGEEERGGYGPQAIVLSATREGIFLRANIWPSPQDRVFTTSGAHSFIYGVPHDHNFDFLTIGHFGPGYRSDYFEYDYEAVAGYRGEPVELRFVERSALSEGRLMHYRAHRDVHSQLPPASLSVSLNVMVVDPAQGWCDQYGFDLERREIRAILNPSATETFVRLAVALGGEEAQGLARWLADTHPSDRLRLGAWEALALAAQDEASRDGVWAGAERCGSRMVAREAQRQRRAVA